MPMNPGNMIGSTLLLLLVGALVGVVRSEDCLVGDIMYRPGDSIGYFGYSCMNGTHFEGSESFCGNDGNLFHQDVVLSCSGTVPHCVQCGTLQQGSALCLSTPDVPDYCDDSYVGPPRPEVAEETTKADTTPTTDSSTPNGSSGCLVGDIMYQPGDSIGARGYSCINETYYDGSEGFCGENGEIVRQDVVLSCSGTVPYCVPCGTPEKGAALCLSTPNVPDHCDDSYVGPPRIPEDEEHKEEKDNEDASASAAPGSSSFLLLSSTGLAVAACGLFSYY